MGIRFDWEGQENADETTDRSVHPLRRWLRAGTVLTVIVACAALLGLAVRHLARPTQAELLQAIELLHATETRAVDFGDHALFLSLQPDDPAWRAAGYQMLGQSSPQEIAVSEPQQRGDSVRAWHRWGHEDQVLQRVVFYRWQDGRLRRAGTDPAYWGTTKSQAHAWGTLTVHAVDLALAPSIAAYIDQRVADLCMRGCLRTQLPLQVIVAPSFAATVEQGVVQIPSPQLVGVTPAGRPGAPFWQEVDRRLIDALMPATIRFALPGAFTDQAASIAARFQRAYPEFAVELVPLDTLSGDPAAVLGAVDAAMIPPTAAVISSGLVLDLTDLAESDPEFQVADLYAVAQQAAYWQERLWMVPQHAEYRLIHADRATFAVGVLSPPDYLARIWHMPSTTYAAPPRRSQDDAQRWGFLDISADTLFAHAYDQRCRNQEAVPCRASLRPEELSDTLAWYAMRVREGTLPDVSTLSEDERRFLLLNSLSYPRRTPMWAGLPGQYEHNYQLGPLDVVAFSGADGRGITPFQVYGSVISAASIRPRAAWHWIHYLSRARPLGSARNLPVFATTANEIGYWQNLPDTLRPTVEAAVQRGRAIDIAEAHLFAWPDVAAVIDGTLTADEAASAMIEPDWFGHRRRQ